MALPGLIADPEWKQYLRLGEKLLSQSSPAAQCMLIEKTIEPLLGCKARVWLAPPYYPLPGEETSILLPHPDASELVLAAFNQKKILFQTAPEKTITSTARSIRYSAFPLLTRDDLLGVLEVSRPQGPVFRAEELNFIEGLAAHAALSMQTMRQVILKNWRLEQLSLVSLVSEQIANVTDLDLLCRRIVDLIQNTFQYHHVAIYSMEGTQEYLKFRAAAEQSPASTHQMPAVIPIDTGLISEVARSGDEQMIRDILPPMRNAAPWLLPQTRSQAILPIKIEHHILGVIEIQSQNREGFHEVDMLVLRALADTIARAFEGTHLLASLEKRAEQISALFEITHTLTSILELNTLLDTAVETIRRHFGYNFVHIFTIHHGRGIVSYLAGSGARSESMHNLEISYNLHDPIGLIPWAARNNQTRLANDVSADPIYRPTELPPDDTRSELVIPLSFGGEALAVLDIQSSQSNAFDPQDLPILESLSASLAIAFHNARLYSSEQWRRQVGDSFRDVASMLSANVALDHLLDSILTQLEHNLPCDSAAIWLIDEALPETENRLRLAAIHGVPAERVNQTLTHQLNARHFLEMGLTNQEATIRQPEDPIGPMGYAMNFSADYSSIAAPLRIGNTPIGVLALAHHTSGRYGHEARAMTETFASYAAVAIQIARLYSQAQEQAWVSTILLQIAEASQSVNTVDELLSSMVRLTRLLVGIKKSAIFIFDADRQAFELRAWYGMEQPTEDLSFLSGRSAALDQLKETRDTVFIADAQEELSLPAAGVARETGTLVLVPLIGHEELLGAFLVAHEASETAGSMQTFDQQTLAIYQGIVHQTAVALENLHLLEARQEEAYVTAVLLQVAQAVVSQNDLVDILDTIVHLLPILVGVDTCIIYLWDSAARRFKTVQAYTGSLQMDIQALEQQFSQGDFSLLDCVRLQDAAFYSLCTDQTADPLLWLKQPCEPVSGLEENPTPAGLQWILGFPLSVQGQFVGALLIKERTSLPSAQQRRMEIMNGIAQQVALAIQNDRLRQEAILRVRQDREIQLARQIQQTFLPNRLPNRKGWEMAARWQPAREVGGDFYDIFTLPKERLGISIADVSDKGMPAALYMTVGRTLIRAYATQARSAATLLKRINTPLVTDTPNSMFITAIYVVLWPETGQLMYANAGHNRPYILRGSRLEIEQLPKGGMAMGVLEHIQIEDVMLQLDPGDTLLLYTDGVTESFSPGGETFGEARLLKFLQENIHLSAKELLDGLEANLTQFRAGEPPSDDITIVAIHRLPPA